MVVPPQMWEGMDSLEAWGWLWMDKVRGGWVGKTCNWASDPELYPTGP